MLQAETSQFGPINDTEKAGLKEKSFIHSAKLKCSLSNNHISPIQFIKMILGEISILYKTKNEKYIGLNI